ncbi:MAG: FtsW/RodA/SpoVE family cell cycle protein [Spirochaetia bacterium]
MIVSTNKSASGIGSEFGHRWSMSFFESMSTDETRGYPDSTLLFTILSLLGTGLIFCFSTYYHFSSQNFSQHVPLYYFISRQLLWAGVGLGFMLLACIVRLEFFYKITPFLWILTVILNLLPVTGIFGTIRGGSRWIYIGSFTFQPSELAKLTLALYLARVLYRWKNMSESNWQFFVKPLFMTVLLCIPIYLQNNLSTSVFIFGMSLVIFFMAGVSPLYVFFQAIAVAGMSVMSVLSTWRIARLTEFLNNNSDVLGTGMQPTMARRAIESAGLLGKGLGNGTFKMGRISLVQSDYIFAAVIEEIGVLGGLAVILGFLLLLGRAWQVVQKDCDDYESTLMLSLALLILGQAFLHIGVVVGIMPVTGVPMPFFSAGGSSLAITLLMCGIMLNISRRKKDGQA